MKLSGKSAGLGIMCAGLLFILLGVLDGVTASRREWGFEWIFLFGLGGFFFIAGVIVLVASSGRQSDVSDVESDK